MSKNKKDTVLGLATALLALLVVELGGSAAPADTTATGGGDDTPSGPTLTELREQAQTLLADGKAADIKKILTKFKAESLTKLDAKHYAAVKEAFDGLAVA